MTSDYFNQAVDWGISQGARNIQWVGGEPTIHLPAILDVMSRCARLPPVVWKSDFHGTPEVFSMLDGIVDVYVADLKFGNDDCARRIAGIENYLHIVTRNLIIASKQTRLIVRHLLLPGHQECCYRPVTAWMKAHLPDVPFSLREGYMPSWRSRHFPELSPAAQFASRAISPVTHRAGSWTSGHPMTQPPPQIDEETCVTEITVQADGRVYVFGTSRQILEILETLDPHSAQLQRLLGHVRDLETAGGER